MIAQALRLHQTTIDRHISEFLNKGKLKPENGGSDSKLSVEQTVFLISQLSDNLFHHTRDVIAFVTRTWNIIFSIPGMNKWLHRNGFTYKKNRQASPINSVKRNKDNSLNIMRN
ncbi:transposase [Escherichia coli]|nr:transposase [Escherichia coli]